MKDLNIMQSNLIAEQNKNEIVLYQPDETIRLEVRMENETVWLRQQKIAELFQKTKSTISFHIANIFKEKELDEKWLFEKFELPLNMVLWLEKHRRKTCAVRHFISVEYEHLSFY